MIRVHRIPHSTNVERVALAAGIKGVEIAWVDHGHGDRAAVLALSGQELVPVAEFGTDVVVDSIAIIARLEREHPEPRLWSADSAARAREELFVEWFNEVWKGPPNALATDGSRPHAAALAARVHRWTERFEALLSDSDYLLGPVVGIADVCAYPFLRYAVDRPGPDDDDRFHAVLHELLAPGEHSALDRWLALIAELPRA